MTASSSEKWPTPFQVKRVSDSLLGKDLTFFFVTGVVNQNQYEELNNVANINILAEHELETNRLVVSTLINQEQLEELNRVFEPLSRSWRGQYQVLAKAVVAACEEALKG